MDAEGDRGWILDAHLCSERKDMITWIVPEQGSVFSYREQWNPSLHVSGLVSDLEIRTILKPLLASALAKPRPIPADPPVTKAHISLVLLVLRFL